MHPEHEPITALKGVGPKLAEKLARLKLETVQDLLFHLPFRYQDRTRVTPLGALRPGREAVVRGRVELADVVYRGRRALVARISDNTGHLNLRFFHFSGTQQAQWERGRNVQCFGEVRFGPAGYEMVHPEYAFFEQAGSLEQSLTPVYPTTEGLYQPSLRKLIRQALDTRLPRMHDWLPESARLHTHGLTLQEALTYLHLPPSDAPLGLLEQGRHAAQLRLVFEELLAHHLSLRQLRAKTREQSAKPVQSSGALAGSLLQELPFGLTGAQRRVLDEIVRDLREPHPMQRLVQGDVGSGKTIVAAAASLQVVEAGGQVALMAPTELLAEQHFRNFDRWLSPLGVEVAWLSGSLRAPMRRRMQEDIESGKAKVVVGTHALFQEGVAFADLRLIIVDEQHRFGVDQRLALREKGSREGQHPHQLVMSATPIPRTLAQTMYIDLDVSLIDELPPGRTPVETVVVPDTRRGEVVARVREWCKQGRQAYWVCPLIAESETLELQTVTETEAALRAALPELRIGFIHGRLKSTQKEKIMAVFKDGEIDLLVATTVIEVGVDVPNASLMIIENAERLGLAQLHQLRGRVGRGAQASVCVLMYRGPLSEMAKARLACMRETTDGFEIARRDLELRGPGEMFGLRQTGLARYRIADLARDQALLPDVAVVAAEMTRNYPDRVSPLIRRWLGQIIDYAQV